MLKRLRVMAALMVVGLVLGGGVATACGDKFILLGRGARVARSKFPSTILIYMNPSSRVPAADKEFRLEAVLKAAGHKAQVVETQGEVQKALASGKYDLVLADSVDVPELRKEAGTTTSKPVVLPILYNPTPVELAAAEKEANCAVRPSKQTRDLLIVVDQTMQDRRNGTGVVCEAGAK